MAAYRPALWLLSLALAGCGGSSSGDSESQDTDPGGSDDGGADGSESGVSGGSGSDDGADDGGSDDTGSGDGPHALGVIALAETHDADGGPVVPSVSIAFWPDATAVADANACAAEVGGCSVFVAPQCDGGCESDQACSYDDACAPACQRICDAPCGDGETCYFPTPNMPACKAIETFDAGALVFAGTTVPLTLFPPYAFTGDPGGSLFAPGASLSVSGSGATAAGYDPFEREFMATTFVQSGLDDITRAEAFGTDALEVSWAPGADEVTVRLTVTSTTATGTVSCPASDADGTTIVPRAAIEAAGGGDPLSGMTVSVTRTRVDRHTDLTAMGSLNDATVQPVGWLDLTTISTEATTLEGCGAGLAVCGDDCVDTDSDPDNCGACGNVCAADCQGGGCVDDGSCAGICGQQAASGCWCNMQCEFLDDCCPDYQLLCT